MRIAQIAPPFETLPPPRYGGTERVVSLLTESLVARGHEVTLFAAGDSHTTARLIPTVPAGVWASADVSADLMPFCATSIAAVAAHVDEFDVIHNHLDYWGFPLAAMSTVPVLTTLHGRLDLPVTASVLAAYPALPLISISNAQRQPVQWANFVATVYHGIDVATQRPRCDQDEEGGGYLAWIGRIAPEKGLDVAIRVARQAGRRLKVAAREPLPFTTDTEAARDRRYFEDVIQPLLREPHVDYLGELGGEEKSAFFRQADALLFPVDWPEPFGLVMAEALAVGTPVIAFDRGSVPEVVTDGLTGYVCADEAGLVEAIGRIDSLSRRVCRRTAERRFGAEGMAEAYERVYRGLLGVREPISFTAHVHQRQASGSTFRQETHLPDSSELPVDWRP